MVRGLMRLAGLLCATIVTSVNAAGLSDDAVRIGVLTDMSGPYADLGGRGSVKAAEMAVADFGGTVTGKPVQLLVADHQNKPDVASSIVREWIDQRGLDMVVDALGSPVGLAVAKIVADRKRIMINTGAVTARLTNEDCTAYTIHYVFDSVMFSNGTARALLERGMRSWYFLAADNAFGASLEADVTKVVREGGGSVVGHTLHPVNTPDFSSFLVQAQSSGAQIVALANAGQDTINSIKTAAEFGMLDGKQKFAGLFVLINDIHALAPAVAQGLVVTDPWYWDLNDATRAFARRFYGDVKTMPNSAQAGIYSAVTNYLKAIEKAGTDDADSVMKTLKSTEINDLFATHGYIREDGRMIHDVSLMEVKKPSEVKYPWDYLKFLATVKGEDAFLPLAKSVCPLVKK